MTWTFSWPSKPKNPWIQYILKVVICPPIPRWRFEEFSLHDVRLLLSQRIFFLGLQQFSLLSQQHTQAFCLPARNILPSRILVGLHLIWTQNQLKNWKKKHKLLMTWTGWWNSKRRPHQSAPDKKARALALLLLCQGMWSAPCQGASSNLHLAAHLFQELIPITETVCHEQWPPGTEAAAHPCPSCKAARSVLQVLHRHPPNKWAGLAWCWLLNPGTSHLLLSQSKESLLFLAAVADRHLVREGQGVERQHRLKDSWHESGKKENTVSVHCFCLLTGTVLSLEQLFCDQTLLL